jgi:hypothetical protein
MAWCLVKAQGPKEERILMDGEKCVTFVIFNKESFYSAQTRKEDTKFRSENLKGRDHLAYGRPRHKWEDDIRMDLRETRCEDVDWIRVT